MYKALYYYYYCLVESKHMLFLAPCSRKACFWIVVGVALCAGKRSCPSVGQCHLSCACPYTWAVNLPSEAMHARASAALGTLSPAGRGQDALVGCCGKVLFPHFLGIAPQLVACSLGFRVHCGFVLLF